MQLPFLYRHSLRRHYGAFLTLLCSIETQCQTVAPAAAFILHIGCKRADQEPAEAAFGQHRPVLGQRRTLAFGHLQCRQGRTPVDQGDPYRVGGHFKAQCDQSVALREIGMFDDIVDRLAQRDADVVGERISNALCPKGVAEVAHQLAQIGQRGREFGAVPVDDPVLLHKPV